MIVYEPIWRALPSVWDYVMFFQILLDCGMHPGYSDERRFPDFTLLGCGQGPYTGALDAVVISHFHLDHVR